MKNINKSHRRDFLKTLGILSLAPVLKSCDSSTGFWGEDDPVNRDRPSKPIADIMLEGTEEEIARAIQNKHPIIQELYNNPGKELTIGFIQERVYNILRLSFTRSNLVPYLHLRLVNTRTNETANVIWGSDGIYPTIKFVDNSGNTIVKNGKILEFKLNINPATSPADWIIIGIKIFGMALILWVGFSLAKYIASALAFIAFNAMAIGLVLAGVAFVIQIIQWILNRTGIQMGDIVGFFQSSISAIVVLLLNVMNYLVNYFG